MTDLWSLTNIVDNDFLGTETDFNRMYANKRLDELTAKEIADVENKVNKIMLRRLKEDVLEDLPEKMDIHTALTPSSEEMGNYNELVADIRAA